VTASDRLQSVIFGETPSLFLSPHLDDAVLSCGALIHAIAPRSPTTVATVFTEAASPPHTRAARSFLSQCRTDGAAELFADRRREDHEVLDALGARYEHMAFPDALFRSRDLHLPTSLTQRCPELIHRYPTYRFDIAKGRISRGDSPLIDRLAMEVDRLLRLTEAKLLFCPIGVGQHVDHLIVRTVGERFLDRVVFYADFPYTELSAPDPKFIKKHKLHDWSWSHDTVLKQRMIRGYRTQVDALFPSGHIPDRPEIYFTPGC
jgi:LmbE family N-acetylglucosaminyl deacetylase